MSEEEQRRKLIEVCARDEWLIDTAHGAWLDVPLAHVDLIIALDYPRWLSLQRLLRRTVARVIDKRPICNGNTETWREMFSQDSIIAWHFRSFSRKRERIADWAANPDGPRVLRFTSALTLNRWIATLQPVAST